MELVRGEDVADTLTERANEYRVFAKRLKRDGWLYWPLWFEQLAVALQELEREESGADMP